MSKRKTNEQYQLELLNTDYEALEEYKTAKTKILHFCLACQYEWQVAPNDILSGYGCPECAGRRKKKTHTEYCKELKNTEYEPLELYIDANTKIKHKHKICGYEWSVLPRSISGGHGCPKCSSIAVKTHDQYYKELENTEYEALELYIDAKTKIKHKHRVCGYEWESKPNNILSGFGCPMCAGRNSNIVYLMYFSELQLYKIGISNNPVKRAWSLGHKCDIVWTEEYPSYIEATAREKELLEGVTLVNTGLLKSGNTETFYEINDKIRRL